MSWACIAAEGPLPQKDMNGADDSLADEIVANAMRRYQQGQDLVTIAADLGVGYRRLSKATASARAAIRRHLPKLAPEIVEEALARNKRGQPLTAIARDMGVNYSQLVEATTASRPRAKRQPRRVPIPDHQITHAVRRYEQGEPLKAVARDMGVDYQQLVAETAASRSALPSPPRQGSLSDATKRAAIARWNAGETLKAIASDLGRATLQRHADLVLDDARRHITSPADLQDIRDRHDRFIGMKDRGAFGHLVTGR